MKVRITNPNYSTKKVLLQKLNEEGKGKFNNIEQILSFKKPKVYRLVSSFDNKKNNEEQSHNQAYNEALNIIKNFNKQLKSNLNTFHSKKTENDIFIEDYKNYKNTNKKMFVKDDQRKNYIFGNLIDLYNKKGVPVPKNFYGKDAYKDSGLLMITKKNIEDFYDQEIFVKNKKDKEGVKSIKFLQKLSDEVGKIYKKKMLKMQKNVKSDGNLENNDANSLTYEEYYNQKKEKKEKAKQKKEKYFLFFEQLNSNINEIQKQEEENKKLKELISFEEEKYKYINNSINNEYNNNISNHFIESYNNSNKKNRNRNRNNNVSFLPISNNETQTIDTFCNMNKKNNSNISNSYYNNNELMTSSTLVPKNNSIFNLEKNKIKSKLNKNIKNLALSFINNKFIETKINNLKRNNSCMNIRDNNLMLNPEKKGISKEILKKRKLSAIEINTLNSEYQIPTLHFGEFKKNNRRESFLPKLNFNKLNISSENIIEKQKNKVKKNNVRNNSQPNLINKKKPINEIYAQITKININAKKKTNNKDLENLYKSLYGDKIPKCNRNSISKEIVKHYYNVKNNIIGNEPKNSIYLKYRELLPDVTINKIKKSNELNQEIKNNPVNYVRALYNKKFLGSDDKKDLLEY